MQVVANVEIHNQFTILQDDFTADAAEEEDGYCSPTPSAQVSASTLPRRRAKTKRAKKGRSRMAQQKLLSEDRFFIGIPSVGTLSDTSSAEEDEFPGSRRLPKNLDEDDATLKLPEIRPWPFASPWTSHNEIPMFVSRPVYMANGCIHILPGSKHMLNKPVTSIDFCGWLPMHGRGWRRSTTCQCLTVSPHAMWHPEHRQHLLDEGIIAVLPSDGLAHPSALAADITPVPVASSTASRRLE